MALLLGEIALSLTYGEQLTTSYLSLLGGLKEKKDCYVHTNPSPFLKHPFRLRGKKASLAHFHTWGCQAEGVYNPQEKLDPRTLSGYFLDTPRGIRDISSRSGLLRPSQQDF